jgi:hypothetical protein
VGRICIWVVEGDAALGVDLVDVEDADEAIFEAALGEVDDEAQIEVGGLEAGAEGESLGGADLAVAGDDFDEELVFDEEIAGDGADLAILVLDGKGVVALVDDVLTIKFGAYGGKVHGLVVAGAQGLVNFDGDTDEATGTLGEIGGEFGEGNAATFAPATTTAATTAVSTTTAAATTSASTTVAAVVITSGIFVRHRGPPCVVENL